jgi:tetratricopeptide (TPR) repeat protein
VNKIIEETPVGFAYDWKAHDLLLQADTVDSGVLDEALACIETAVEDESGKTPSRYRKLASIASCKGDIDCAIHALKKAAALEAERDDSFVKNETMALELALLYVRRGRSFVGAAIEELMDIPDAGEPFTRDSMLVTLYSFIGEQTKADELLAEIDENLPIEHWCQLLRSYSDLFSGNTESSLKRARDWTTDATKSSKSADWYELMICAGAAVEVLERHSASSDDEDRGHIVFLAEFLTGESTTEDQVLAAWKDVHWSLKELAIFREFAREHSTPYDDSKLDIIESLIRQQELESLKGQRRALTWFQM